MQDIIQKYIQSISKKFSYEETTEMGYRTDFEDLLKGIFESINVRRFDHDAKSVEGNKPDFVVRKNDIPILYIEAKDIGISLDKVEKSDQMSRYFGYANLVLTDYVEFRFYRNGIPYGEPIKIAEINKQSRVLTPVEKNYEYLTQSLLDFTKSHKEPIKSGKHLAKIMGGKAQRIRDNLREFLLHKSESNQEIEKVYETIKKLLVHDLSIDAFSDMYAQTLVYGLFVARFYDKSKNNFTRQEARDLIPKSNPFLRDFFDHIVGPNFDKRLEYIVDELCEVFSHADVQELMKEYFKDDLFGGTHRGPDPVIHFYEDFLKEYDFELRKKMGAYYTPQPVVHFITHSVDYLLRNRFGIVNGLADTSKSNNGIHRVQILDPAVGTGTFISAVISVIYANIVIQKQQGRWPAYVHNDLLPRLHGFELMMTPYTISHLKIGMAFKKTGFNYFNRRLGIYLTNTLEKSVEQKDLFTSFGFANTIAEESKEAAAIKNKTPIMVVLGNPPYSGESSNRDYKGNDVYKVEPSGGKLQEKNSKWLNDDYVKFIRYAESMVEKTGEGIVAMITAHGYIDNPTFRGMRWHLMNTFDEIFVLDLHGNSNKKEKSPDGSEDKNVFDIKTGVSIFFGIKKKDSKQGVVKIYHADLYGKRPFKFEFLDKNLINTIKWEKVTPITPNYEWIKRDEETRKEYEKGFSVTKIFPINVLGYQTHRDNFAVSKTRKELENRLREFCDPSFSNTELVDKYHLNTKSWDINKSRKELYGADISNQISETMFRPFDKRYVILNKSICDRPRTEILNNIVSKNNICLLFSRQQAVVGFHHVFITNLPANDCTISTVSKEANQVFPLYLFNTNNNEKIPNIDIKILGDIEKIVGKTKPEDIFDYIYSILHSPIYRKKYEEFLKIDFPRVPYPKDKIYFNNLVKLGKELREVHLLESLKINKFVTTFPNEGSDVVEKTEFKDGNVYINNQQYFGDVPKSVWEFYIGGYQPAQKWLKDRKGQKLTNEDLEHYQKIIVALNETIKVMDKIDEVWGE